MRSIFTLLIGILFGTGISMSGMTNPTKVVNFFDITGTWGPSRAFVMALIGGILVTRMLSDWAAARSSTAQSAK